MKDYLLHFPTDVLKVTLSCRCKNVFCLSHLKLVELQGLGVRSSFKTGLKNSSEWWLAGLSQSQEAGLCDTHHTKTFFHKCECAVPGSDLAHLARIRLTVILRWWWESLSVIQSERGSAVVVRAREGVVVVGMTTTWVPCPKCTNPDVAGTGHWALRCNTGVQLQGK